MDTRNKAEKFWDKKSNYFDREERKDDLTNIKIIEKPETDLKLVILFWIMDVGLEQQPLKLLAL